MINWLKRLWQLLQHYMQKKRVRQAMYILTVLFSLVFIGYAILTHWSDLRNQRFQLNPIFAGLVVLLYPIGTLPATASWHWLLKAIGVQKSFRINLRLFTQSLLPRHIPGLVWYVSNRALLYQEHDVGAGVILAATAAETAITALSGFCLSALYFTNRISVLSQFTAFRVFIPISIIIVVGVMVYTKGGTRWLNKWMRGRQPGEEVRWRMDRNALWISLIYLVMAWAGGGVLLWLLIQAIFPVDWQLLPAMIGIWGAAGAVSLTIGIGVQGMGLREVTLGALLSTLIPPLLAVAAAIAFRLLLTLGELLWVFIIVTMRGDRLYPQKKT